jgi:hypothetical protein
VHEFEFDSMRPNPNLPKFPTFAEDAKDETIERVDAEGEVE